VHFVTGAALGRRDGESHPLLKRAAAMFRPEHHNAIYHKREHAKRSRGAHASAPKRRRHGKLHHHHGDEEGGPRNADTSFMDEKQLERSLNLGVERIASLCHDGLDVYVAILKAVDEVNAKADRDSNLAVIGGEQLAAWFDILAEGRHRKRKRRRRRKRGPTQGSALEVFLAKEEAKYHVEPAPRVANRGPEIREAMRGMLDAWRDLVRQTKEMLAKETERLRKEMMKNTKSKINSKDEERRYYQWVIFSAWKLYLIHKIRARRRAARRAKFQAVSGKPRGVPVFF
jgi:hypothetical protein